MSNTDTFDDVFAGSGPPAAKFEKVGDVAKGIVVSATRQNKTDIDGNVQHFQDGNPKTQAVVTIRLENGTEERIFCKWEAEKAIKEAVDKAGGGFKAGGTLAVKFTGEEPADRPGRSPKKLFVAQYEPPAQVEGDIF